jgi:hypothetical protein
MAQVVECLTSKYEALNSTPVLPKKTPKKQKKKETKKKKSSSIRRTANYIL